MEFIKVGKNYMIKNGNGRIISEKEKLELENEELIIKDIQSNECQGKTTQKIIKNKKRLKKIEDKSLENKIQEKRIELFKKDMKNMLGIDIEEDTASIKENADDIIKETDSTI